MHENQCKICRRTGQKLFLKGDKCFSPKCPYTRRPYPPGQRAKRRRGGGISEYGKELIEKQKLRNYYGLSEKQFKKYIKEILEKRGKVEDTALELIKKLEKRLDNVVFRAGLAESRSQARQLVSHSHFLINKKSVNIPSYQVKKGDILLIKENKKDNTFFKRVSTTIQKAENPSWIKLNKEKVSAEISGEPSMDDLGAPVEISAIFEYYSR